MGTSLEPSRRRVLLVAPNLSRRMGGEAFKALQIHLELRAMGFDVRQVAHGRVRKEMQRDQPALMIDYVSDGPIQAMLYRLQLLPLLGLLNAWQLHRLAQQIADRHKPDVVHFTSPISPVLPYFRFRRFPVVVGPLNGNVAYPPAFAAREARSKTWTRRMLGPLQWMLGNLFRGKRSAILLVAGGERTRHALRLGGCRDNQFHTTLDSGITDRLLDRARFVQSGENCRFVYLGRLVDIKGCDLAIKALALAGAGTTLDVIGDGPERSVLGQLAIDQGVADRVCFLGWMTPGDEMYDSLAKYRALVLPSLAEANGIAFQEAMALGLPIMCLDWAGPREIMTSVEAIMIPPDGERFVVKAIAKAMNELADHPEMADALSARARARALELGFRWRDILGKWDGIYQIAGTEVR